MSDKKYTLTVYLAAPGTPVKNLKTGTITYSLPGHAYYAVSDGMTKQGFGFAPTGEGLFERMNGPGRPQSDEYKKYQNPHYERTMEITEAQYRALVNFGKRPQEVAGFNQYHYNFATNSCVDFTFNALKHAGIYKGRQTSFHDEFGNEYSWLDTGHEGLLKVLPNKRELEKIPNPVPGSSLNRTIERPLPPRDLLQRLLSENRQQELNPEQPQYAQNQRGEPYQYAQPDVAKPSLRIEDMPQFAQNIYRQGRQIFTEFCQMKNIPYDEKNLDNIAMSMAAAGYANHMRGVSMINIKDDGQVLIGHKAPELRKAAVDMAEAASTPIEESLTKVQQTARQFEYEEQQRQLAQSQSYGISRS